MFTNFRFVRHGHLWLGLILASGLIGCAQPYYGQRYQPGLYGQPYGQPGVMPGPVYSPGMNGAPYGQQYAPSQVPPGISSIPPDQFYQPGMSGVPTGTIPSTGNDAPAFGAPTTTPRPNQNGTEKQVPPYNDPTSSESPFFQKSGLAPQSNIPATAQAKPPRQLPAADSSVATARYESPRELPPEINQTSEELFQPPIETFGGPPPAGNSPIATNNNSSPMPVPGPPTVSEPATPQPRPTGFAAMPAEPPTNTPATNSPPPFGFNPPAAAQTASPMSPPAANMSANSAGAPGTNPFANLPGPPPAQPASQPDTPTANPFGVGPPPVGDVPTSPENSLEGIVRFDPMNKSWSLQIGPDNMLLLTGQPSVLQTLQNGQTYRLQGFIETEPAATITERFHVQKAVPIQ